MTLGVRFLPCRSTRPRCVPVSPCPHPVCTHSGSIAAGRRRAESRLTGRWYGDRSILPQRSRDSGRLPPPRCCPRLLHPRAAHLQLSAVGLVRAASPAASSPAHLTRSSPPRFAHPALRPCLPVTVVPWPTPAVSPHHPDTHGAMAWACGGRQPSGRRWAPVAARRVSTRPIPVRS